MLPKLQLSTCLLAYDSLGSTTLKDPGAQNGFHHHRSDNMTVWCAHMRAMISCFFGAFLTWLDGRPVGPIIVYRGL